MSPIGEKQVPIDLPILGQGSETVETHVNSRRRGASSTIGEDWYPVKPIVTGKGNGWVTANLCVPGAQRIARTHHRVSKAKGCHRKFNGHVCFAMLRSIDAEMWLRLILSRALKNRLPRRFSDHPGQVVIEDQVLIMPANNTLSVSEKAHDWSWMDGRNEENRRPYYGSSGKSPAADK